MGLDSRKKSAQIVFDTQNLTEIGPNEAGKARDFSFFFVGND